MVYSESLYLLYFCTNPIVGPRVEVEMLSSKQNTGFLNRQCPKNQSTKYNSLIFCKVILIYKSLKLILKFLGEHNQNWAGPLKSRVSEIGCVLMNWSVELGFADYLNKHYSLISLINSNKTQFCRHKIYEANTW